MLADAAERNDIFVRTYTAYRLHAKLDKNVRFIVERVIELYWLARLQVVQLSNLYARKLCLTPYRGISRRRVCDRFQNRGNAPKGEKT
jgi:hypothetical protein